jgi:glycosyltransferase involved in cell wall biosynthesis
VLESLRDDREALVSAGRRGADFVREHHDPRRAARLSRSAIESFATRSAGARYRRLVGRLTAIESSAAPARSDLIGAAQSIAANRHRRGLRQLLLDVSALAHTDLRTGVERVSRAVLKQLIERPPDGYRVELVRETDGRYVYAREAAQRLLGLEQGAFHDAPIDTAPGDVFLGLDLAQMSVHRARTRLRDLGRHGVRVVFVVYDLLPALRPDCFPDAVPATYREWLQDITSDADGLVCISRTVADELTEWLHSHHVFRTRPLHIGYFHLGADLAASLPTEGIGAEGPRILESVGSRPTFLMVGTVEPRKGHALALEGVEALWDRGVDVGLVVVGKEGWESRHVTTRLRTHGERGRRLHWVERASDELLLRLYEKSAALLAASEGEGFGLPLVEAAQHGLPIIARDIPVFREVGGDHAYYFSAETPAELAGALSHWLTLRRSGEAPASGDLPWLTWAESAESLMSSVLDGQWYTSWPEPARP